MRTVSPVQKVASVSRTCIRMPTHEKVVDAPLERQRAGFGVSRRREEKHRNQGRATVTSKRRKQLFTTHSRHHYVGLSGRCQLRSNTPTSDPQGRDQAATQGRTPTRLDRQRLRRHDTSFEEGSRCTASSLDYPPPLQGKRQRFAGGELVLLRT